MPAISRWLRLGAASVAITAPTYGAIPAGATDRSWFAPRVRASWSMSITTATAKSFLSTPANSVARASWQNGLARRTAPDAQRIG